MVENLQWEKIFAENALAVFAGSGFNRSRSKKGDKRLAVGHAGTNTIEDNVIIRRWEEYTGNRAERIE